MREAEISEVGQKFLSENKIWIEISNIIRSQKNTYKIGRAV